MHIIYSIIITLVWLSSATAGTIKFDFTLTDNRCVVVNRGDSSAYYPTLFQLDSAGQWIELKVESQPTELPSGTAVTVSLIGSSPSAPTNSANNGKNNLNSKNKKTNLENLQILMIRFFDQSGVSFGHIVLLHPPPESNFKIAARYLHGNLQLKSPVDKNKIRATWVIAPFEEGISPIFKPLTFKHRQPATTKIEWNKKELVEVETGAGLPEVILLHETLDDLTQQKVAKSGGAKKAQRTAWLNMRRPFYLLGLLSGLSGIIFTLLRLREEKKG